VPNSARMGSRARSPRNRFNRPCAVSNRVLGMQRRNSSVAEDQVITAQVTGHTRNHLPQHCIPCQVAVAIVDALEVVDVHHGQDTGLVTASESLHLLSQAQMHGIAVPGAREVIHRADAIHGFTLEDPHPPLEFHRQRGEGVVIFLADGLTGLMFAQQSGGSGVHVPVHTLDGPETGDVIQLRLPLSVIPSAETAPAVGIVHHIIRRSDVGTYQRAVQLVQPFHVTVDGLIHCVQCGEGTVIEIHVIRLFHWLSQTMAACNSLSGPHCDSKAADLKAAEGESGSDAISHFRTPSTTTLGTRVPRREHGQAASGEGLVPGDARLRVRPASHLYRPCRASGA
jgi:hypothetical protein